jgi:hypothetical protein
MLKRKPRKWTSIRRRFLALTSNEQVFLRKLKKYIYLMRLSFNYHKNRNNEELSALFHGLSIRCIKKYVSMVFDYYLALERPISCDKFSFKSCISIFISDTQK